GPLSVPAACAQYPRRVRVHEYDVLVIGSGFGGSVAALRLTEKGYRVGVLEAGRRFGPADFARTNWNLRRYLFMPRLGLGGTERVVREVARRMGVADTFRHTVVAVDFDRCVRCGGCMVGCRYEAKNTLDRNYLRLAEDGGATVHPEREATLLRRVGGGWEIETV